MAPCGTVFPLARYPIIACLSLVAWAAPLTIRVDASLASGGEPIAALLSALPRLAIQEAAARTAETAAVETIIPGAGSANGVSGAEPSAAPGEIRSGELETGEGAQDPQESHGVSGSLDGATVVRDGDDIEIRLGSGARIMLRNGYYVQIAPNGEVVVNHVASAKEQARVAALAREVAKAIGVASGAVRRVDLINDDIRVTFADGHRQEVTGDIFRQRNADKELIVERPASVADREQLEAAAETLDPNLAFSLKSDDGVVRLVVDGEDIEVTYSNGMVEQLEAGRLTLISATGETFARRDATPADRARLEAYYAD